MGHDVIDYDVIYGVTLNDSKVEVQGLGYFKTYPVFMSKELVLIYKRKMVTDTFELHAVFLTCVQVKNKTLWHDLRP